MHNPDFKPVEFGGFRKEAGLHAFTMSPSKWVSAVNAIGIVSKAGRYGGTYAHSDIALEFAYEFQVNYKEDKKPSFRSDRASFFTIMPNLNYDIKDVPQGVPQDVPQGVPQEGIDDRIIALIRENKDKHLADTLRKRLMANAQLMHLK